MQRPASSAARNWSGPAAGHVRGGGTEWGGRVLRLRGRKIRVKQPGTEAYGWTRRQADFSASRSLRGEMVLPAARIASIGRENGDVRIVAVDGREFIAPSAPRKLVDAVAAAMELAA